MATAAATTPTSCCEKFSLFMTQQVPARYQQYNRPLLLYGLATFITLSTCIGLFVINYIYGTSEVTLLGTTMDALQVDIAQQGCLLSIQQSQAVTLPVPMVGPISFPLNAACQATLNGPKYCSSSDADAAAKLPPCGTMGAFAASVQVPPFWLMALGQGFAWAIVLEFVLTPLLVLLLSPCGIIKSTTEESHFWSEMKQFVGDYIDSQEGLKV